MEQKINDCLKRFTQAWADQDMQALSDCMSENVVYNSSIGITCGKTWYGKADVLAGITEMIALDNAVGEISPPIIVENKAFHTWVYRCKDTGEITAKGCDMFHFENGLISLKDAYRKVTS